MILVIHVCTYSVVDVSLLYVSNYGVTPLRGEIIPREKFYNIYIHENIYFVVRIEK